MRKNLILVLLLVLTGGAYAQLQLDNLKLNGYVQTDFELAGKDGSTYVAPAYSQARDGDGDYYFRYGVRRGLIRATFEKDKGSGALELNITESGVMPLVAFLQFDPYKWLSFQGGLLNIDYGWELMYPSSMLETIERSVFTRMLFPKEHDLGFKFTFLAPLKDENNKLKLSLAMMSGNGINKIADKNMNFMSHLTFAHNSDLFSYSLGASYYEGKTNNADSVRFETENGAWHAEQVLANKKNARRYIGFEATLSYESFIGRSTLRGECSFGIQPSREKSFASQDNNSYNLSDPFSYQRHFWGFYFCYLQDFDKLPFDFVAKYTCFDQNSRLSNSEIRSVNDALMHNIGVGIVWTFNPHICAMLYYDFYINETNRFVKQQKDDVCHLRLQYRF